MKQRVRKREILTLWFLLLCGMLAAAQSTSKPSDKKNEEEKEEPTLTKNERALRRTADLCFKSGDYQTALELYKSLVMTHPDMTELDYRLGACYFYTNDRIHARKYLSDVSSHSGALLLMGDLSMREYDFETALSYYDRAQTLTPTPYMADVCGRRKRGVAEARRMLNAVQKVTILDSMKVTRQSLFSAYNRRKEMGQVYRLNKAKDFRPRTGYMTVRKDRSYQSDTTAKNGLDLFVRNYLVGGWSEPLPLRGDINTPGDENFPFLMEDGVSLYFASTHHNSIGGYDLYLSRTNEKGEFMKPVHLGMPFNSTWNDYLMEIDEENRVGWWASDRYQNGDTLVVYTFRYEELPSYLPESATYAERMALATLRRLPADSIRITEPQDSADSTMLETPVMEYEESFPMPPLSETVPESMNFEIMEGVVYHDLKDFKSGDAKAYYQRGYQLEQEREKYRQQLNEKRDAYQSEMDKWKRQQLGREIIVLERRLGSAAETAVEKNYRMARNCEIRKLKLNR
jgi:tetratricopeptide (TPR) repeat protein